MKQVAKLVIIDNHNKYLMMYRDAHPVFGNDPDLPGGTLEEGEQPLIAMTREVYEETGIEIGGHALQKIYEGAGYSKHKTYYSLYVARLEARPNITLSWEHSAHKWLDRAEFLEEAKNANDTYMHMVYDVLG
ncbi:MAG TPA: NUDIX hydrolase [Candidatus Saccharimonadales bacterium]|jgi:8-oxo-dGTP pyrophosphatase MutT (NUDIX family)|nr:NUDIX hydrolase [Candidatus Saccharimonadales bacterium]